MNQSAESFTVSSKNCNHVNLVKLQKNKVDNTITLDIMTSSPKCKKFPNKRKRDIAGRNVFKFSLRYQLSSSAPSDTPFQSNRKINSIVAIRAFSLFWIVLWNVQTILAYSASMRSSTKAQTFNQFVYFFLFRQPQIC